MLLHFLAMRVSHPLGKRIMLMYNMGDVEASVPHSPAGAIEIGPPKRHLKASENDAMREFVIWSQTQASQPTTSAWHVWSAI